MDVHLLLFYTYIYMYIIHVVYTHRLADKCTHTPLVYIYCSSGTADSPVICTLTTIIIVHTYCSSSTACTGNSPVGCTHTHIIVHNIVYILLIVVDIYCINTLIIVHKILYT